MPEIFRTEKNGGFINIWQLNEPLSFFDGLVNAETFKSFSEIAGNGNRLLEKLVPHYILKQFNPGLKLDNTNRKPVVDNGFISVSHCKNFVAISYSPKTPVGVDIEYYSDRILKIRHKYLDEKEKKFCGDDSRKCIIVWAAKEAIFKKYGGETAFFAENIHLNEMINDLPEKLTAKITIENKEITENLFCELFDEFAMVYTL